MTETFAIDVAGFRGGLGQVQFGAPGSNTDFVAASPFLGHRKAEGIAGTPDDKTGVGGSIGYPTFSGAPGAAQATRAVVGPIPCPPRR